MFGSAAYLHGGRARLRLQVTEVSIGAHCKHVGAHPLLPHARHAYSNRKHRSVHGTLLGNLQAENRRSELSQLSEECVKAACRREDAPAALKPLKLAAFMADRFGW